MKESEKSQKVNIRAEELDVPEIDYVKYIGMKSRIENCQVYTGKFGYYLKVETEQLNKETETRDGFPLRASRLFNLRSHDGKIGWTPKSDLGQYLARQNVKHYDDLVGHEVLVLAKKSENAIFLIFE